MSSIPSVKLCHWGLWSCRIVHIWVSQPQYLLSTWWGLWLACSGRTGLVLSPSGDADLWLDGLCQTVLSVSLASSTSLWQIWRILTILDGLERTVPCAGRPWSISAGDGRSAMIGVWCSWSNALAWALGDLSHLLVSVFDLLYHWLDETVRLMEVWWRCGMNEIKVTGKLPKLVSIEGRSVVRHRRWLVHLQLWKVLIGGWWSWNDDWMPLGNTIWELTEVICHY